MPSIVPVIPKESNYQLSLPLNGVTYSLTLRWNSRDNAWYFDLAEDNGTIIAAGLKIVLGTNIGRQSTHPFFFANTFTAYDNTDAHTDAAYDDFGTRIVLVFRTFPDDLVLIET